MNADAKLDAPVLRHARVALDHGVLHSDRATHGVHDAAELDYGSVAGSLHHAAVMDGDGRVDEIASQGAQASKRPIRVRAGQATEADQGGSQDTVASPANRSDQGVYDVALQGALARLVDSA